MSTLSTHSIVLGIQFIHEETGIYSLVSLPDDVYKLCNTCIFAKLNNDPSALLSLPYSIFELSNGAKVLYNECTDQILINNVWNDFENDLCIVKIKTISQEIF